MCVSVENTDLRSGLRPCWSLAQGLETPFKPSDSLGQPRNRLTADTLRVQSHVWKRTILRRTVKWEIPVGSFARGERERETEQGRPILDMAREEGTEISIASPD